jgi:hypothetical protein
MVNVTNLTTPGWHFSPHYFAVKAPVDDSWYGPRDQPDTPPGVSAAPPPLTSHTVRFLSSPAPDAFAFWYTTRYFPVGRVGTLGGCQIGYMDHTGCHQLIGVLYCGVVYSRLSDGYMDHTGCHQLVF